MKALSVTIQFGKIRKLDVNTADLDTLPIEVWISTNLRGVERDSALTEKIAAKLSYQSDKDVWTLSVESMQFGLNEVEDTILCIRLMDGMDSIDSIGSITIDLQKLPFSSEYSPNPTFHQYNIVPSKGRLLSGGLVHAPTN